MRHDLTKQGPQEPDGMIDRFDLRCECGAHVLERPDDATLRFSCARYWRGQHGVCWAIASPESRWAVVPVEGQLDLFGDAAASTVRSSLLLALSVVLVLGAAWLAGWAIASAPHPPHLDPFDPATAVPYREDPR